MKTKLNAQQTAWKIFCEVQDVPAARVVMRPSGGAFLKARSEWEAGKATARAKTLAALVRCAAEPPPCPKLTQLAKLIQQHEPAS